jgi:hypothetical protein
MYTSCGRWGVLPLGRVLVGQFNVLRVPKQSAVLNHYDAGSEIELNDCGGGKSELGSAKGICAGSKRLDFGEKKVQSCPFSMNIFKNLAVYIYRNLELEAR